MATSIFDHTHPKIIEINFNFPEFSPACKKISLFHLLNLEIQSILESLDQTGHSHFWPCSPKKFLINFKFMWISISMHKIRLFQLFVLETWLVKKSCNLIDWVHFPKYGNCPAKNINFHYRTNLVKINDQIFLKIQKILFLVNFSNFGGKKCFSRKSGSVMHNFMRVSSTMPKVIESIFPNMGIALQII